MLCKSLLHTQEHTGNSISYFQIYFFKTFYKNYKNLTPLTNHLVTDWDKSVIQFTE